MRLGIVTSHPIQYQVPLFRALAERVDLQVYFAHRATADNQAEAGFGVGFDWDTDLTSGFRHTFLRNVSSRPSIMRFGGCDTPDVGRSLAADQIDALLVYGWHFKAYLQAARAARSLDLPVMARTDSHLDAPRSVLKRVAKAVGYPVFLRWFDAFLPTGTRAAAFLQRYRVPQKRIFVVPYCIDVDFFERGAAVARNDRERIRAEYGAASNEFVVLFVGKLIELKRVDVLLDALGSLVRRGSVLRLFIVGTGPLEAAVRRQASELGIPTAFMGFVNQSRLAAIYVAADLLVLPSQSETWGLVVNEAFACGLPAVLSDRVGCAPDMIREDLTGRIVPVGDSRGLANAIQDFAGKAHDPTVRDALAEMTAHYSPARSAEAVIAAAKAVLGKRGMHRQ
jgi:glycosyltransferase involved in cell wall biosynthesis